MTTPVAGRVNRTPQLIHRRCVDGGTDEMSIENIVHRHRIGAGRVGALWRNAWTGDGHKFGE
jgi:hypothetical protein